MKGTLRGTVLIGFLLLVAGSVSAQKIAEVVLANGNAITGEIKSLQQGKLKYKTDHAGTIYIEWEFVLSLSSSNFFEVENRLGEFFYGMLGADSEERKLIVIGPTDVTVIEMERVVTIMPLKQTFWGRIDGSFNLGTNFTSADSIWQYSVESDANYRQRKYNASITLSSIQTRQEERETILRDSLDFTYTRFHMKRFFSTGSLIFSRNSELGIDFRTQLSYAFGRTFIQTNRSRFSANAGLAVSRERPIGGESSGHYLSGLVGTRYHFFLYSYPKTDFVIEISILPGITDWPRVRGGFNATLKREIITDFTVNFSAYDSYDSDPPSGDMGGDIEQPDDESLVPNHDYGFILSIGWTF